MCVVNNKMSQIKEKKDSRSEDLLIELSKKYNIPIEQFQNKCIGDIEKLINLKWNQSKEEKLRNKMRISGSFYITAMPWFTYDQVYSLKKRLDILVEKYSPA